MLLVQRSVEDFLTELASDSPAPGGGTIAALVGSFAAGLGMMACRLTIGNEKYPEAQAILPGILRVLEEARDKFLHLIDADTEAFNKVMSAFKMPKGTEEEIAARKTAIFSANLGATEIPLTTAEVAVTTGEALVQVVRYGNKNTLSDIGTAVECAHTAAQAAFMNIAINLPSLKNDPRALEIASRRDELTRLSTLYSEQALLELREKLNY